MTLDERKAALQSAGLTIKTERRVPNESGIQVRLSNGAIVNCFDNGTLNLQGKNRDAVEKAVGARPFG